MKLELLPACHGYNQCQNKQIPIKKEIFHFGVVICQLVILWPQNAILDSSTSWSIAAPNPTRLGQSRIHRTDRWFNQKDRRLFEQLWHVMSFKIVHSEWKAYLAWKKSGLFRSKSQPRRRNSNVTIFLIQIHRIYEKSFFCYTHLFLWSSEASTTYYDFLKFWWKWEKKTDL